LGINPAEFIKFDLKILSINNIDGKWYLLMDWDDSEEHHYIIFKEQIRFRHDIMRPVPPEEFQRAIKERMEATAERGKDAFQSVV